MDYYKILNVDKNASEDEIKKSYRKLAMKHHPDRNPDNKKSEEEFKKIGEAYSILSDPIKRENYDNGGLNNQKNFYNQEDIADFMRSAFGGKNNFGSFFDEQFTHRTHVHKTYGVSLSFWEAIFGVNKKVEIINSQGVRKTFNIALPKGLENGVTLEVSMANEAPFHVYITVDEDPNFTRDNLDLYTSIDLNLSKAILGGTIKFPHWEHDYEVTIPPGIQNGQTLRLSNAGIKKDMFVGDLYLKCNIVVPKKLNKKQKELIEAFSKTEDENTTFFDNLKQSWNNIFKNKNRS